MSRVSRRRVITIAATFAALPRAAAAQEPFRWRGVVMGAVASLELHHPDRPRATAAAQRALAEARRLERIFSLYDPASDLSRLNAAGHLIAPPAEMIAVLDKCRAANRLTEGAFDPTVQPLWEMYARHYAGADPAPAGPGDGARAAALRLVGLDKVRWSHDRIVFAEAGVKLTFNGVAQGYISDRVAEVLTAQGFECCLIDMGEPRLIGHKGDGSPWRVGVGDPEQPGYRIVELADGAIATTAPRGFVFSEAGNVTHLFDPATGRSPEGLNWISIAAPDAATADALSTGLALRPPERIPELVAAIDGVRLIALSV